MNTFRNSITAGLFCLGIFNTPTYCQIKSLPIDTGYTVHHEYNKIHKYHPYATIASTDVPNNVNAHLDITYLTIPNTPYGTRELKADIFQPKKQGHYPTVIMIHGGGWRSGNKSMQHAIATRLASKGFVTVCPAYQLSQEALYPNALYNIKAAIRWAKDHAQTYSIDTSKIATSGCSAGGQLAMLAALTSGVKDMEGPYGEFHSTSDVQAVIDIDGAINFISPLSVKSCRAGKTGSTNNEWLHGSFFEHPDIWREASPIFWADKNHCPPILFLQSGFPRFSAGIGELTEMMDIWDIYYKRCKFDIEMHPFWLFNPWVKPTVDYMAIFLNKVFPKEL